MAFTVSKDAASHYGSYLGQEDQQKKLPASSASTSNAFRARVEEDDEEPAARPEYRPSAGEANLKRKLYSEQNVPRKAGKAASSATPRQSGSAQSAEAPQSSSGNPILELQRDVIMKAMTSAIGTAEMAHLKITVENIGQFELTKLNAQQFLVKNHATGNQNVVSISVELMNAQDTFINAGKMDLASKVVDSALMTFNMSRFVLNTLNT